MFKTADELVAFAKTLVVDPHGTTLNPYEEAVRKWKYGEHGGFFSNLWCAIVKADFGNLLKLYNAFPVEIVGYVAYGHKEGWWEAVAEKMARLGIKV